MRTVWCIALMGLTGVTGCVHSSTEELSLGGAVELDAISGAGPASDDPSALAGVDRSEWPLLAVVAPNDQTTELPRFVSHPQLAKDSPRRRGERPRALSAVELDLTENGPRAELLAAPVVAGVDVLLIPFRTQSPKVVPYERGRNVVEPQPVVMPIEVEP